MNQKIATESFDKDPIIKLVIKNALPAIIAMIMVMIYNLADVFFIGLTHNDYQVAAVSFASPIFMIFMSLGTLFGVGGTSLISRAIGAGDYDRAKKVSSFCTWSCITIGIIMMISLWGMSSTLPKMLGATDEALTYTYEYITITISCGVFSMLSNCYSNILRAEGKPMNAMTGTIIGNLLNLILDPIFILVFGWGVKGAAIATVIGNIAGALYYLFYFFLKKSNLSINPKDFTLKDKIPSGVISIGLSASLANLLVSISSIIANKQLSSYDQLYVAGYGVTAKVIMIVSLIGIGLGAGVQPLFGYFYGSKNKDKFKQTLVVSTIFALILCFILGFICFILAEPIVKIFLTREEALSMGVHFTKILMSTTWLVGAFVVWQNVLQAMGYALPSLFASIFRQGLIFIPALFIMQSIIGVDGIIWAQPIADILSTLILLIMLSSKIKKSNF